jgi:hypothetical protein
MLLVPNTNKYYEGMLSFHVITLSANLLNKFQGDSLSSGENHGILVSRNQPFCFIRRTVDKPISCYVTTNTPTASAGFEPANLGTRGQHASSRPPKPLMNGSYPVSILWQVMLCFSY